MYNRNYNHTDVFLIELPTGCAESEANVTSKVARNSMRKQMRPSCTSKKSAPSPTWKSAGATVVATGAALVGASVFTTGLDSAAEKKANIRIVLYQNVYSDLLRTKK